MSGTHGEDLKSTEAIDAATVGESAYDDGDPFHGVDGLVLLRKLAQESNRTDTTHARLRGLLRRARQDPKNRTVHDESLRPERLDLANDPVDGPTGTGHTQYWCPTVGKNILMRADRSCPVCGEAI